jgi:transposase
MGFRELSDGEWEVIRPLPPPRASVGTPRIDDRLVVNGMLYVLVTCTHYSTFFCLYS